MTAIPSDFALPAATLEALAAQLGRSVPVARVCTDPNTPRSVLITGGAGFLAVHLLHRLVQSGRFGQVYLLVRRPEALAISLSRYGLDAALANQVQIVVGDLNDIALADLPAVDVVMHSAARIHGLKSLKQLWRDNVAASARLFAHYSGKAELHLVSTLSVFVSSNLKGVHQPYAVRPYEGYSLYGGYAQSKYICERLADTFGAHVIRLGLLTGSSTLGRFPENDFFTVFLRSMKSLGCQPDKAAPAWVDVTPVDLAAERIVQALDSQPRAEIVHIANCYAVSAKALCDAMELLPIPAEEFKARVARLPGIERVLLSYAFFKKESLTLFPHYFNIDLFQSTGHTYGIRKPFTVSNDTLISLYLSDMGF